MSTECSQDEAQFKWDAVRTVMKQNNRDIWKIKFQTNFDHWHEVSSYGTLDSDDVVKSSLDLFENTSPPPESCDVQSS